MFLILWILVLGAVSTVSAGENPHNKEPQPSDWRADMLTCQEQVMYSLKQGGIIDQLFKVCDSEYDPHPLCLKIHREIENCSVLEAIETCKEIFKNNPSDIERCERSKRFIISQLGR